MSESSEKVFAKKSLGQHFLRNDRVIENIIKLGDLQEGEQVMEIGPGPGALTSHLYHKNFSKLWLLEKDDVFAKKHMDYAEEHGISCLQVYHMDALTFDWQGLQGQWKIMGNLPYNVASPMMWDIVSQVPNLSRAVFMIQKEVAQRIRASKDSKTYGALSVWMQSFCKVEKGLLITPSAFTPPPKVDSEVIVLKPLAAELLPKNKENLAKVIKICFQQRRKQLHGLLQKALPDLYTEEVWAKIGLDKQMRAENLSPKDFQNLSDALFKNIP